MEEEGWKIIAPQRVGNETPLFICRDSTEKIFLDLLKDQQVLRSFAMSHGVSKIIINHLIDLPLESPGFIQSLSRDLCAQYEILLHDYFMACPRIDLIDSEGRFCDLAGATKCALCLGKSGPVLRGLDPNKWRAASEVLLSGAARVVAPSEDHARRLRRTFPGVEIEVWEPEDDRALPSVDAPPPLTPGEPMRVLLLGALNHSKGQSVVLALARELSARKAHMRLTLLGPASDAGRLKRAGVRVLGRYLSSEVEHLIRVQRPHLIFLPAIWPETWSFVLTEALRSSAVITAFDLGAIAERLRRLRRGRLIPYAFHADPVRLADFFLSLRSEFETDAKLRS